jgi:hypothetical protein
MRCVVGSECIRGRWCDSRRRVEGMAANALGVRKRRWIVETAGAVAFFTCQQRVILCSWLLRACALVVVVSRLLSCNITAAWGTRRSYQAMLCSAWVAVAVELGSGRVAEGPFGR